MLRSRPARHVALTSVLVLVTCLVVGWGTAASFTSDAGRTRPLTARATGHVRAADSTVDVVTVEWSLPDGRSASARVAVDGTVPTVGSAIPVAYAPGNPGDAVVPGAAVLADADRAGTGVLFAALIGLVVLGTGAWQWASRRWAARRPGRKLTVRRVRVQRGLLARSWLETEPGSWSTTETQTETGAGAGRWWLPVHFDPALVELPAPATVTAHGARLVAVTTPGGVTLYPSGRVRDVAPRGKRTDSPQWPDDYAAGRARVAGRLRRQFRADAALLVPAPLVGLVWAYLDGGGVASWLAATALAAALGLWWAALRGSDPS